MTRLYRITELIKHKIAFAKIEKQLLGKNTIRALTHDTDKLIKYLLFMNIEKARKAHKKNAKHHNPTTRKDYYEKITDYECARFSKRNSPLTAREYVEKKYAGTNEYYVLQGILQELDL